jgi:hypothetical protein
VAAFNPRAVLIKFVLDQVTLGQVVLAVPWSSSVNNSPRNLHTHLLVYWSSSVNISLRNLHTHLLVYWSSSVNIGPWNLHTHL